jgi:hypothetical protein
MAFAIHLILYTVNFNDREGSEVIDNLLVVNKYYFVFRVVISVGNMLNLTLVITLVII